MVLKHVNAIDYAFIILYMFIVAATGVYLSRYNRNTADYFKGGGRVPWLVAGLSNFVSGFSAYMFVAAAGYTYKNGIAAVLLFTSAFWAYWLGYFIYGVRWRRTRLDSPAQYLTRRFSQSTTYFYTFISVLPSIVSMGIAIYTLSIFISSALGISELRLSVLGLQLTGFQMTMIGTGVVMIVYTGFGGLWAVVITDFIQFLILMIMTLVIFPVAFIYLGGDAGFFGGVQKLLTQSPPGYFHFGSTGQTPFFFMAFVLNVMLGYNVRWHVAQRYYSVPDERDTRKMAVLCSVLSLIGPLMWIVPTMVSRQIFPDIAQMWPSIPVPEEASFVSLALLVLPHGMIGVVVSAMFAATMSSADTTFNWLSAVITKDIYVPLARQLTARVPSDRTQLRFGKTTIAVIGVLSILVSIWVPRFGGAFDFTLKFASFYDPSLLIVVAVSLLMLRTPWWSGIAAASAGVSVVILSNLFLDLNGFQYEFNTFLGSGTTVLVLWLSRYFPTKKAEPQPRLESLIEDLRTPALVEEGADVAPADFSVYGIIGKLAMGLGLMLMLLPLAPVQHDGKLINFYGGALAFAVGLAIFYFSRRTRVNAAAKPTAAEVAP